MTWRTPPTRLRGMRRTAVAILTGAGLLAAAGAPAVDAQGGGRAPAGGAAQGQAPAARAAAATKDAASLRVIPVRGNIYLVTGAGGNVAVSAGRNALFVVDTGSADKAEALLGTLNDLSRRATARTGPAQPCLGAVRACEWWSSSEFFEATASPRAPRPIGGIINTSSDPDRIGGNAVLARAGRVFGAGLGAGSSVSNAWIVAHENVALAMSKMKPAPPDDAMPSEGYFGSEKKLNHLNGEAVIVSHRPAAHTDGDSMVFFRGSDVLVAGPVFDMHAYPVIDVARGGTIDGVVAALNWILDIAVVEHMMEGGTIIIPGRGRLADAADVAYYRDMMTILRDRVQAMKDGGMTLKQVQAANLTKDYDPRFARNPAWTPNQLVEAIFTTLKPKD